jgi:hypothetical protein
MKFYLLFIASLFCGFYTLSQKNNGYYGHKGFIQVESVMSYPFFSNILSSENNAYTATSSALIVKKDHFNIGFRVNAGYAIKRNVALSFEYGQDYSSVYLDPYNTVYTNFGDQYFVQHEMLDITTNVFIPKIEFGTSKSLLPMGLSHQIGFGISNSKVKEKDYLYRYVDYSGASYTGYAHYSTSSSDIDPINFSNLKTVKRYVILYALSMRSPITKNLMIHYGLKYTLNVGKKENYNNFSNNSNEYFTSEIMQSVAQQRLFSLMSFNIGLTFAF